MKAKGFALQKLSRRSYLSSQMQALLEEKGVPGEEIAPLLEELKSLGYLNDREWVEQAVRREIRAKHGPLRIRQKLRFLGVEGALIDEVLEALYPEEQRLEIIDLLVEKFNNKEKQKKIASISRLGFSIQEILKVCYNKNKE